MRTIAILILVGWLALTAAPAFAQTASQNFVGYAQTANAPYSSICADWSIPNVVSPVGGATFKWIGISGVIDTQLIQIGTFQNAGATYLAAWANYPSFIDQHLPQVPIVAGDHVHACVTCTANCSPSVTQTWQVSITNTTTSATVTVSNISMQSTMSSANALIEAPISIQEQILGDFGVSEFTNIIVNATPISFVTSDQITMADPQGGFAAPSAPTNGNNFNMCYSAVSLPSCAALVFGGSGGGHGLLHH